MFEQLKVYRGIASIAIIGILAISFYFYIAGFKSEISNLKHDKSKLQKTLEDSYLELANEKLQSTRYKSALDNQNAHIKALELNETLANAKLRKWKEQKPEVRYRTITKIREVKSDDCKKIKSVIDDIRHTDISSLYDKARN